MTESIAVEGKSSMRVLEHAEIFDLPDMRVAVCGDWHGNVGWVRMLAAAIGVLAPDVSSVLQLGDWSLDPQSTDAIFANAGIERVLVTPGNHEVWPQLTAAFDTRPDAAVRVSERTWLLPRPYRLQIGGRRFLSLGGAASVDREWRVPCVEWWPDEAITDEHVRAAIADGPADVMLTHESPARTPVRAVRDVLRVNPLGIPKQARLESAASRLRVGRVWDATGAGLLLHGHMHTPGDGVTGDGRRVISLGRDCQEGHVAFLDLPTLHVETPSLDLLREASRNG